MRFTQDLDMDSINPSMFNAICNLNQINTMRYTDDGYISTEVELPDDGSLVEHKIGANGEPRTVIYRHHWNGVAANQAIGDFEGLGPFGGYWRYVDTPEKEKRDSGHPSAIQSTLGELRDLIDVLKFEFDRTNGLLGEAEDKLTERQQHIQNLERIISGQRRALASKEQEVKELKERLASSDKLSQEGWISAEDRLPKPL